MYARIAVIALVLLLLSASTAAASFHHMRVNEVMLSTGGNAHARFVELLDPVDEPFDSGNGPYRLVVYDAGGQRLGGQDLNASDLKNRTTPVLISTADADTALGSTGDETLNLALPNPGQVCYTAGDSETQYSCVAWGCVTKVVGSATRVQAPPDGQSVQRQGIDSSSFQIAQPTPKMANTSGTSADCPGGAPPDSDGDGVPDSTDKCPTQAAATPSGCPAVPPPQATDGNDVLSGDALANTICGLGGDDTINGLAGNDILYGDACNQKAKTVFAAAGTGGNDVLDGGDGDDTLFGAGGNDKLKGGAGKDKLNGGAGKDKLNGGAGKNSYKGGPGNDSISARNGVKESIDCGSGKKDKATVDRADKVKGCEKVKRPKK